MLSTKMNFLSAIVTSNIECVLFIIYSMFMVVYLSLLLLEGFAALRIVKMTTGN